MGRAPVVIRLVSLVSRSHISGFTNFTSQSSTPALPIPIDLTPNGPPDSRSSRFVAERLSRQHATLWGDRTRPTPGCSILPAGLAGKRSVCPAYLDPAWPPRALPVLGRARVLLAGTGERIQPKGKSTRPFQTRSASVPSLRQGRQVLVSAGL